MKNIMFAVIVILLQNCQQSERVTKPTLDANELANVLGSYPEFNKLVSSSLDYSKELNSNYSNLSKEKLTVINKIISKYVSPENLSKNASPEEIKVLLTIMPQKDLGTEFKLLSKKLQLKFVYSQEDLVNLIVDKIESQETNNNAKISCGDERCQHEAMAAYFLYISDGMGPSAYADMFMYGVYYHCRMYACA